MEINAKNFIEDIKNKYNFITNKQVAEHFGVTRARISQWLQSNKIPLKYINSEDILEVSQKGRNELYQTVIKKQLDHIAILEEEIQAFQKNRKIFYKEVSDNWQYDVKVITTFASLKELQPSDITTVKTIIKNRSYFFGYTKEEFESHFNNWASSSLFDKDEVYKLSKSHEKRRITAIQNNMDSFTISNKIRIFKKNGDPIWSIYKTYYDLSENLAITKIQFLDTLAKD